MATSPTSEVLQHLRRAVLRDGAGLTDGQLLANYLSGQDEAALATLVRRHGPMVWGVCRRVLGNPHDAEDAFQATFLVLIRKAASIVSRESLANWLYGVARQTALNARAATARRKARERQVVPMPEPKAVPQDPSNDLRLLIDQELSRLPDKYRAPIVLCDLEGKTRQEAARQLGCPVGTVAGRLARARVMLARRLARHGLVMSGGMLAGVLSSSGASACVPASVVASTIRVSALVGAGSAAAATGLIPATVATLTEGVLRSMVLNKFKIAVVGFLVVCTLGIGVSALIRESRAADPASAVSKAGLAQREDGNLRETVLALEKRIWEGYAKQDAKAFENLVADDFVCIDLFGNPSGKAGVLDYVARFRVVEHTMKDVRVVVLNAASAIVTYEVHYKVRPTDGGNVETTTRRVTAAWTQRKGRWWYVYFQDQLVNKQPTHLTLAEVLSISLGQGSGPRVSPPKD
jgi:RNA polymerase sigma factor (sigma-70 family)